MTSAKEKSFVLFPLGGKRFALPAERQAGPDPTIMPA